MARRGGAAGLEASSPALQRAGRARPAGRHPAAADTRPRPILSPNVASFCVSVEAFCAAHRRGWAIHNPHASPAINNEALIQGCITGADLIR